MAWGLVARGLQMRPQRTYLKEIRLAHRDWAALAVGAVLLGIFIALHVLEGDRLPGLKLS
jgi:energy-coupling factor transporter transmembrane protein EcfT